MFSCEDKIFFLKQKAKTILLKQPNTSSTLLLGAQKAIQLIGQEDSPKVKGFWRQAKMCQPTSTPIPLKNMTKFASFETSKLSSRYFWSGKNMIWPFSINYEKVHQLEVLNYTPMLDGECVGDVVFYKMCDPS